MYLFRLNLFTQRPVSRALQRRSHENGYVLLVILVFAAILSVVAVQQLQRASFESQREKEEELVFRGLQYQHAIGLFFRKFGRYPTSVDELIQTNNIRFLRKKYRDPMTKDGEWRIIRLGPNGALVGSVTNPFQNPVGGFGASGSTGTTGVSGTQTTAPGPGFGGPGFATGNSPTAPGSGSNPSSAPGSISPPPSTEGIPNTRRPILPPEPAQPPAQSAPPQPNPSLGSSTPSSAQPRPIEPSSSTTFSQVIGGGIAGFASQSKADSIRVFNKYSEYDKWEFIFDFRRDQLALGRVGGAQQQTPAPPVQTPNQGAGGGQFSNTPGQGPFGGTAGGSPFGNAPGTSPFGGVPGTSPFSGPTPTPRR